MIQTYKLLRKGSSLLIEWYEMLFGVAKHSRSAFPHVLIIVIVVIPRNVPLLLTWRVLSTQGNSEIQLSSLFGSNQPQIAVINVGSPDRIIVVFSAQHFLKVKVLCGLRFDFLYRLIQLHRIKKVTTLIQSQSVPALHRSLNRSTSPATHPGHVHHACGLVWDWSFFSVLAQYVK